MNDANFYISLIIVTLVFAILGGGAIFQGGIGPTPSKDLFILKPGENSLTGVLPGTTPTAPVTPKSYFGTPSASPHQGKVRISYVSKAGTRDEFIALYGFPTIGTSITVTGWKLRSTVTGAQIAIDGVGELPYINSNTEWRMPTGQAGAGAQPLWQKRGDIIQLLDNNGRLVDVYRN